MNQATSSFIFTGSLFLENKNFKKLILKLKIFYYCIYKLLELLMNLRRKSKKVFRLLFKTKSY